MGRSRDIAEFLSKTETNNPNNNPLVLEGTSLGLDSAQVASVGLKVFQTLDSLPTSNLISGQQALVDSDQRLYISNGLGWYNIAVINQSPTLTIDPSGTITLATDGSPTTLTLTATDSDTPSGLITFSVESDGNFSGLGTLSQDSSVFTITPKIEDSATTTTSTLTFKASDGINFGTSTSSLSLTFGSATGGSKETLALVKADNVTETYTNTIGLGSNNFTLAGSMIPGAKSPYAPGGHSMYFQDSAGTVITLESPSTVKFTGTDNFTISGWMYVNNTGSGFFGLYNQGYSFQSYMQGGYLKVYASSVGSPNGYDIVNGTLKSNDGAISNFTWHHFAIMRSGSTWGLYIDGVWQSQYTLSSSGSIYDDASLGTCIGNYHTLGYPWYGYLRDFKVDKAAIYTAGVNFTPPTSSPTAGADTRLLITDTPHVQDKSSYKRDITISGTVTCAEFSPFDADSAYSKTDHIGSEEHDGTDGSGFVMPANAGFGYGTGDFSIEMWYYHKGLSQASNNLYYTGLWDQRTSTQSYSTASPIILYDPTGPNLEFWYNSGMKIEGPRLYTNQWHHIAVCRVSGTITMYLNGRVVGTPTSDGANFVAPTGTWGIGYSGGDQGGLYAFNGYIADCRVLKGSSAYSSEFTPPTAPLTAITNTKMLISQNRAKVWDAKAAHNITKGGNPTVNTSVRKWSNGGSLDLDGSGDRHSFFMRNGNIGQADFTVEGWFYFDTTNHQGLFQLSDTFGGLQSTNYGQTVAVGHNGNNWQLYGDGSATGVGSGSAFTLSTGQWYHVAAVRYNGTSKLYIDGVENISFSDTYSYGCQHVVVGGYYSTSYLMDGKIQDFRITKGLARYTENFSPPSEEFTG